MMATCSTGTHEGSVGHMALSINIAFYSQSLWCCNGFVLHTDIIAMYFQGKKLYGMSVYHGGMSVHCDSTANYSDMTKYHDHMAQYHDCMANYVRSNLTSM